ncbi:MAG: pantetheine-phosphate adenylyltransferase, partial [Halobacteriaceae archaeon]
DHELSKFASRYNRTYSIRQLTEPTGIATEQQFDALIVSPETKEGGKKINEIRQEKGYDPLEIFVVDHVKAEDGDIISSTRIVNCEIDQHGNLLSQNTETSQ